MRNLKRTILAAALLLSFSAAGAALGNDVSAASLQAAEPAGPVSNTGRDYRIALINAENSRGPVIHKPLKEEKENPSRPRDVKAAGEGSTYREGAPSLRHHDREESQRLKEHRQHRFDKDDSDKGHRFDEHHQRRFDKEDNDRSRRFDERRQHRFDKDDNDRDRRFDEHRQHRFDKDDNDRDHHFDEHRQRRFDKDDNDRDHRFDEHRQHRFDKDKDPGRGRPGGRHHDRGERKSAAMQPEDARF
ncbi:hypothetical protein [Dialister succinatiphilus]|uniref:hypothetical protein n=1 Tax=Dialister succinatiphilus TaxID=487173 RepID=UPI0026DD2869|nr:hypothetical protein [uncultured Dialister sp.]